MNLSRVEDRASKVTPMPVRVRPASRPSLIASEGTVSVSRKGESRILRGHPWVFRPDVEPSPGTPPGAIVRVHGPQGLFLGYAFYSSKSDIQLRLIQRSPELSESFLQDRLAQAFQRRQALWVVDRRGIGNAYRMVHGEADGLPALIVDRYGDYLVIQTLSEGMERLKPRLVELLDELARPRGILERNDAKVRILEGLPLRLELLRGHVPAKVDVDEAGIRLEVDLWKGRKTGLYLDQRENHLMARAYARGRVLDAFTYTGGFALHVAKSADQVVALDISPEAVEQARQNAFRNDLWNVRVETANALDYLREAAGRAEVFDMIILDPPALAKSKDMLETARRFYREINMRAMKLLSPGGTLITCSCSNHVHEPDFENILVAAAAEAQVGMVLLEKRRQARDHPALLGAPETHYLKCAVLQRMPS
jgi:23S rRNA (cytosine1962-C5)-methyltransferase